MNQETLQMSARERRRVLIMEQVETKGLTVVEAAEAMGVSYRQAKRIWRRYRAFGDRGLVHGLRGVVSNRRLDEEVRAGVLAAYRAQYGGFGPTLASEKLAERDGLAVNRETLRRWLHEAHLWVSGRAGRMTNPALDDHDVILFPEKIGGKFAMLHRPQQWVGPRFGTNLPAMWIARGDDLLCMGDSRLLAKGEFAWENGKIGGNAPPIRTEHGWLVIYHARGADKQYRLGAMLLDLNDPGIVRYRGRDYLIEPEAWYEIEGNYRGCIFPCGNAVIGGTFFVYYGGADKYVGVATCPLGDLIDYLRSCPTRG